MGVNIQFDKARKSCSSQIKVYFVYLADTTEKICLRSYWFEIVEQCSENILTSKEKVRFSVNLMQLQGLQGASVLGGKRLVVE